MFSNKKPEKKEEAVKINILDNFDEKCVMELNNEELDMVAGGNFDVCPPGCYPINNGCACEDDDIW